MNLDDETRLGIGIVGCGRVGAVMGSALRAAGHAIVGTTASSQASRDRAEAMLPGVPILPADTLVERAELVLLTVSDDVLPELVAGLARLGAFRPGQIVMHCAGMHGTEVLSPAAAAGAFAIALHPSLSFTGTSVDLPRLREATIAVTAAKLVLPIGQALVVEIGAEPIIVAEADRALYHAAIAHAANHTVAVLSQSIDVLTSIGIDDPARVLRSLIDASVANTLQAGPTALTGPVSRGDTGTVRAHLDALGEYSVSTGTRDVADAYAAMATATIARALSNGTITTEQAAEISAALTQER